jgi:succinate dehydrogenase / fumarate reductase, cytochrome b subunit
MGNSDRPLSPHLQIYKPQLTAALSIVHRATGVFLVIGTLLLVYWLTSLAGGAESYAQAHAFFGSIFGRVILLPWVFALFYHLCNGIRHLFWDMGVGFEISTVYASGKLVVVAAVALTLATFAMAYTMQGGGV